MKRPPSRYGGRPLHRDSVPQVANSPDTDAAMEKTSSPSTRPAFVLADPALHRDAVTELNLEYMDWVMSGLEAAFGTTRQAILGMTLRDYVAGAIDEVCGHRPPHGAFYLVEVDGRLAGMGGLRRLREGVAEIKRLYVRPGHRGLRLGEALLRRLLSDAGAFGYRSVHLDSAPFMRSAHRLYEAEGFTDCPPYEGTEVPPEMQGAWRFMERGL